MALDLAALDPAPTKVIANLPYGIAAGAILRTIEELPSVDALGRDGAARGRRAARRAAPGSRSYGVPSVLCQLACEVRVLRAVARSVFVPVPNVDSVLVGLTRRGPAPPAGLRRFVAGRVRAPAQGARRARSRSPAAPTATACARRSSRSAIPPDARAERLAPAELRALWEALEREGARRRRRSTSACSSGRRAPTAATSSSA